MAEAPRHESSREQLCGTLEALFQGIKPTSLHLQTSLMVMLEMTSTSAKKKLRHLPKIRQERGDKGRTMNVERLNIRMPNKLRDCGEDV